MQQHKLQPLAGVAVQVPRPHEVGMLAGDRLAACRRAGWVSIMLLEWLRNAV